MNLTVTLVLVGCLAVPSLGAYLVQDGGVDSSGEVAETEGYLQPSYPYERAISQESEGHKDYYEPPHYTYEYKVEDYKNGDFKRHRESRKDGSVEGYYSLIEADGSLRTVHYTADDKNGFNAVVTKTEPQHVATNHQPE